MVSASFTEARSRFLIDRLQNQVDIGKRADSGFKAEAWEAVTTEFNENFSTSFNRTQLKNHFQGLKSSLAVVRKLRDLSGFGWNDAAQIVVAEPDVWNKYIQANPKARQFRDRPFPLFDALDALVGNTLARGNLRRSAKRSHETLTAEEEALDDYSSSDELPDSVFDAPKPKKARIDTAPSNGLKRSDSASVHLDAQSLTSKIACDDIDHKDTKETKAAECSTPISKIDSDAKERKAARSSARRSRANGTQALAQSIEAAVKLEQGRAGATAGPTVFVKEKHADMKKAISLFMAESQEYITELEEMHVGVKILRHESDAAFFITVSKAMRWEWILSEIKQHLRCSPFVQSVLL